MKQERISRQFRDETSETALNLVSQKPGLGRRRVDSLIQLAVDYELRKQRALEKSQARKMRKLANNV